MRYTYHATDGWMTGMKTYRGSTGADALTGTAGNPSLTTWAYDAASKATSYTCWTGAKLLKEPARVACRALQ